MDARGELMIFPVFASSFGDETAPQFRAFWTDLRDALQTEVRLPTTPGTKGPILDGLIVQIVGGAGGAGLSTGVVMVVQRWFRREKLRELKVMHPLPDGGHAEFVLRSGSDEEFAELRRLLAELDG